jgi:hypothetical protein
MTLSTPVKVVALAGLALILGGVSFVLFASKPTSSSIWVPPVKHVTTTVVKSAQSVRPVHHTTPRPTLVLDPSLPPAVAHKLRRSREVVAFVYTGASVTDRALLQQVRKGAHAAGVPFVGLNVTDEPTAAAVHGWAATSADPLTLVVRRPGKIVFQLEGPTDSQPVAQAAAAAR